MVKSFLFEPLFSAKRKSLIFWARTVYGIYGFMMFASPLIALIAWLNQEPGPQSVSEDMHPFLILLLILIMTLGGFLIMMARKASLIILSLYILGYLSIAIGGPDEFSLIIGSVIFAIISAILLFIGIFAQKY